MNSTGTQPTVRWQQRQSVQGAIFREAAVAPTGPGWRGAPGPRRRRRRWLLRRSRRLGARLRPPRPRLRRDPSPRRVAHGPAPPRIASTPAAGAWSVGRAAEGAGNIGGSEEKALEAPPGRKLGGSGREMLAAAGRPPSRLRPQRTPRAP